MSAGNPNMNPPSLFARAGSVPVSGLSTQTPSAIGQPFGHNGMPTQWPPSQQATPPNYSPSTPPTTPFPSIPWLRGKLFAPPGTVLQPQNPTLSAQKTISGVTGPASAATQQIQKAHETTAQPSSSGTTATASNVFAQTPRHDKSSKGSTSVVQTTGRGENQFQRGRTSGRTRLQLLRGPGIDLVIGGGIGSKTSNSSAVTWSLPQALISHYSKKVKEECSRDNQDPKDLRITIPAVDPSIFELFVEWMYDGRYTTEFASITPSVLGVSPDTQAWVLGETLQSNDFKNYVMDRIFNNYAAAFGYKSVATTEVTYACNHTAEGSKLRQIFFDLLAAHFTDTGRVEGSVADWDEVMQRHTDLRMYLLMGIRSAPNTMINSIRYHKEKYMEISKAVEAPSPTKESGDKVVPAKRTVDGTPVKKEPTGD